ncbi:MAG TPA: hypothetical protein VMU92_14185 [Acidobacteriaceae bacterium]|nr:hypothetical protein [Acidobacteriaceae bacterium]
MRQNPGDFVERLQTLSDEQVAEVEDFIDFLRFRTQEREIARAASAVSEPAFQTVWANPEDDIYDAL